MIVANYPLAFAELLAGAILLDKGAAAFQGGLSTTANSSQGASATATAPAAPADLSNAPAQVAAMYQSASLLVGAPYTYGGGHNGFTTALSTLKSLGVDCSGFVSQVLHSGGYLTSPATTVTLPEQAGILPGVGQWVTIWDRAEAGDAGHAIIDIAGQFFESGGNSANNPTGGVAALTDAQAQGELSEGGFDPYHPSGL